MNRRSFLGSFAVGLSGLTFSGKVFSWLFHEKEPKELLMGWTCYEEPGIYVIHDYA